MGQFGYDNIQHFYEKGCQFSMSEFTVVTRSRLSSTALEYRRRKLHMNHCTQKEAPGFQVVQQIIEKGYKEYNPEQPKEQ